MADQAFVGSGIEHAEREGGARVPDDEAAVYVGGAEEAAVGVFAGVAEVDGGDVAFMALGEYWLAVCVEERCRGNCDWGA